MQKIEPVIALNYIYISEHHAGGKDQVALNLLHGFVSNGDTKQFVIFCYDYSADYIKKIAPDMKMEVIRSSKQKGEFFRLLHLLWVNTVMIPKLLKKSKATVIFHLAYNNGLRKFKATSITLPHDIKAISHRVIGKVKIPIYKYLLYKLMYHIDFKHADKIVAISDTDLQEMKRYFPRFQDKLVRIYNPIKVENIQEEEHKSIKKDIVAINLQFHHKNVLTLIKAFEKIMNQIEDNLILVGDVPSRVEYLKKYVTEHNLEKRVIFTGFLSGKKKRYLLINCRLYVNPSLFEGFGMTAVEALILKAPTLLSRVSANYEVTKGLCRYYEPADSPDALAAALIEALEQDISPLVLDSAKREMLESYDYRLIANEYKKLFCQSK
jgi:glycosyltransferase involved in cell wall biosynthesis